MEDQKPATLTARVSEIVVDCQDPEQLATFWSALLGVAVKGQVHEGQTWFAALEPIVDGGPIIGFQNVPEGKTAKNRVHLDLKVRDLEEANDRVIQLGGRQVAEHAERGRRWLEMTDPEGNEFCLTL